MWNAAVEDLPEPHPKEIINSAAIDSRLERYNMLHLLKACCPAIRAMTGR
jgi:hypothetical protein